MNTFDGYIRRNGTNSKVLLDGGNAKALSEFIGTISYANNKITYTKADGTSYDLVDLSNYIYNLRVATSDSLGGIRIGFSQSGKNYPVQLDSNNKAYVYVPWEENSHYTTRLYVGDGTAENKITTNGNTRITVTDNNNVRNYITLIGSGATNISSDDNGKITINSINTTYNTGDSATLNKGTNTEGKLWSAKTLVDYISDILGVDSTAITSLNTLIGLLHDNDTATGILVELAKKLNTPSSSIGSNTQPIYWNGSSFATIGYTIEKSVPSNAIFTDTKYSFYVGENNNTKEHKNVSNPYFKLFENNTQTSIQIKAGTGISVNSDANGNITIKNESPDLNHNTDKTGIKLGTISGTKKTDSTVIINNSSTGLTIAGGTNKFSIGDGTNYIEIPITPSFTVSNKDSTIGTSLTTIATIAGTDIKAKIGSYLPLSGGTMTGHITTGGQALYFGKPGNNAIISFSKSYPNYGIWYNDADVDTMAFSASGNANDVLNADFAINGGGDGVLTSRGNKIWHAGNDGSGSGLDADTVDGYHYNNLPYLPISGGTMTGNISFSGDNNITWSRNTNSAKIYFKNTGDSDSDSYLGFETSDNGNEYFKFGHTSGDKYTEWMSIKSDGVRVKGTKVSLEGHTHSYLPLSGGTMTGVINWGTGSTREILQFSTSRDWKSGLRYSGENNTTISLWGKNQDTAFVWNAGKDGEINGHSSEIYDFRIRRESNVVVARIAGNTVYHSGNLPAYPTKNSWNYDDRYLKLSGGTITGDIVLHDNVAVIWSPNFANYIRMPFRIEDGNYFTGINLYNSQGTIYTKLGIFTDKYGKGNDTNSIFLYPNSAPKIGTNTIYHSGNLSVSKSGETLTVNIGGIYKSLTNTWRGILNNLTSDSTIDSLSAAQGKILNDKFINYHPLNGKITIAGGTYLWYNIQQYNSSNANPSYYKSSCAIININSYTGWQPWIRCVDIENGSWALGQFRNFVTLIRFTKDNTSNYPGTYSWNFNADGSFTASRFEISGKSTDVRGIATNWTDCWTDDSNIKRPWYGLTFTNEATKYSASLSGYFGVYIHTSGGTSGPITLGGRVYPSDWIEFSNSDSSAAHRGLYWPNTNGGAHFYPNNISSYGTFIVRGKRGSFDGIYCGAAAGGLALMSIENSHQGLYTESIHQWLIYQNAASNDKRIGIGTSTLASGYKITLAGPICSTSNIYIQNEGGCLYLNKGCIRDVSGNWIVGKADNSTGSVFLGSANVASAVVMNNSGGKLTLNTNGTLTATNTCTATAFYASSDSRLKNIISDIQYSSEEIASLRSVKYTWKNKNEKVHIGSIALDVERIIPEVVNIDNEGYKSLDYATLGTIGVISLAREIVELKKEIKELKSKLYG